MPIIRNPFRKPAGDINVDDTSDASVEGTLQTRTQPVQISSTHGRSQTEYKLSEINDSGEYLPPSPNEKPRFWTSRSQASTNSSSQRSNFSDNEPFNISRESFDSYRRSFDISARSPIQEQPSPRGRQSLDIRQMRLPQPQYPFRESRINPPAQQPEERFEDVGLGDNPVRPKRQGMFSRFGHSSSDASTNAPIDGGRPTSSHFGFAKRWAQNGQVSELGSMPRETSPHRRSDH